MGQFIRGQQSGFGPVDHGEPSLSPWEGRLLDPRNPGGFRGGGTIFPEGVGRLEIRAQFRPKVWERLRPDVESWVVDTGRYLLVFASLALGHLFCSGLRFAGVERRAVDFLERCDLGANGIVLVMFLLTQVRRAASIFGRYGKEA